MYTFEWVLYMNAFYIVRNKIVENTNLGVKYLQTTLPTN